MSYEIYDHWASIKFVKDGVEFLLAKSSIKKISLIGNDTIKISTGNCMGGISFHHSDVVAPGEVSPEGLISYLNAWITASLLPPIGGA